MKISSLRNSTVTRAFYLSLHYNFDMDVLLSSKQRRELKGSKCLAMCSCLFRQRRHVPIVTANKLVKLHLQNLWRDLEAVEMMRALTEFRLECFQIPKVVKCCQGSGLIETTPFNG